MALLFLVVFSGLSSNRETRPCLSNGTPTVVGWRLGLDVSYGSMAGLMLVLMLVALHLRPSIWKCHQWLWNIDVVWGHKLCFCQWCSTYLAVELRLLLFNGCCLCFLSPFTHTNSALFVPLLLSTTTILPLILLSSLVLLTARGSSGGVYGARAEFKQPFGDNVETAEGLGGF